MKKEQIAKKIVKELLKIGAIKLNLEHPFTWASGWKSPIYCDNRISLSYPHTRQYIKQALVELIKDKYQDVEMVVGVATAGIPQGVLVAEEMGLPFAYIRLSSKTHGMKNIIEGEVKPGQKVVVLEDLVSTGASSRKAVESLRAHHANVLGIAAIFTYGFFHAYSNLEEANIKLETLSNYSVFLKEALVNGHFEETQVEILKKWQEKPEDWQGIPLTS